MAVIYKDFRDTKLIPIGTEQNFLVTPYRRTDSYVRGKNLVQEEEEA